jgi:hypothetical protein
VLNLGPLAFVNPWALAALTALPALWWLLRVTPPAPRRIVFPAVRLLFGLIGREESPARAPWWLVVLRLSTAAVVVFAAARPLFNAAERLAGSGPVVLVIDDGWAAAVNWPGRLRIAEDLIDRAERAGRPVALVTTAPAATAPPPLSLLAPAEARRIVRALNPKPWAAAPAARAAAIAAGAPLQAGATAHVAWLSDGLEAGTDGGAAERVARELRRLGPLTVYADRPERRATVLRPPTAEGTALAVRAERSLASIGDDGAQRWLRAVGDEGRLLARLPLDFGPGEAAATARLDLPSELRNRLVRLELEDEPTAGAVVLMDERWRRRPVGLAATQGAAADQPLLDPLHYLERALAPFAELRRGTPAELLKRPLAMLVLADPGPLPAAEQTAIVRWIEAGGLLVRFAGPRLAAEADPLVPVPLRQGDRAMGGALTWATPVGLAPFEKGSPLFGLSAPAEVRIRRQVLARPGIDIAERTWARLTDGTPLVTADRRGRGWLILVHTTANTEWSDLALSGLSVDMLRRFIALSQGAVGHDEAAPLPPLSLLDGFGRLGGTTADAVAVAADAIERTVAGPRHPPGLYGDAAAHRALNLSTALPPPRAIGALPSGVDRAGYDRIAEVDLTPWLLLAALLLILADIASSLWLRGLLRRPVAAGLATALLLAGEAEAQTADGDAAALAATLRTRLAYVLTGEPSIDQTSRAGLAGLSAQVNRRTNADLAEPVAVDPARDELSFFPLLYWPLTAGQRPPTEETAARLNHYFRDGGMVLFDTRELAPGGEVASLRAVARSLDVAPLVPVPANHVLTKTFYLLREFPGRFAGGTVWVERPGERVNDGVSSVVVGGHDWAGAWATDDAQRPLHAVVPGGERQREAAYRFGINLVMYALTGNYKTDQVHLRSILERLGGTGEVRPPSLDEDKP